MNGGDLTTWCALDTLLLPQILQQTAEVESADPVTGETIRLMVAPEKVERFSPTGAVLSIVIPETTENGLESAEQIRKAFCSYSCYFSSEKTARRWFAQRNIEPILLCPEESHRLGYLWFENVIQNAV